MMEATTPWDQCGEYFYDVGCKLKADVTKIWTTEIPPANEMKCQSFSRLSESLKNFLNSFLEEEQKLSVKYNICLLREEINNLWSLCWCTENEKLSFKEYSVDIYTEEVLNKHKNYKSHLESLYNLNSELFSMLKKFENTQIRLKNLEIEKNDPSRLKNRGAQLLKNEKEFREGKKDLVKLEESILQFALKHNQNYGKPLLIHGEEIEVWLQRKKSENSLTKSAIKSRVRPWHATNSSSTTNLECSAKKKTKLNI